MIEIWPPSLVGLLLGAGTLNSRMSALTNDDIEPGPPMIFDNAARAKLWLVVWCRECQHQAEPDPDEMGARNGADMPVLNWRERLVCSKCGGRDIDFVMSGNSRR
jgi:hypothetical protein